MQQQRKCRSTLKSQLPMHNLLYGSQTLWHTCNQKVRLPLSPSGWPQLTPRQPVPALCTEAALKRSTTVVLRPRSDRHHITFSDTTHRHADLVRAAQHRKMAQHAAQLSHGRRRSSLSRPLSAAYDSGARGALSCGVRAVLNCVMCALRPLPNRHAARDFPVSTKDIDKVLSFASDDVEGALSDPSTRGFRFPPARHQHRYGDRLCRVDQTQLCSPVCCMASQCEGEPL